MGQTGVRRLCHGCAWTDGPLGRGETMTRYSDEFLSDLARLIRHGPEPFNQLIVDLTDPERREALVNALSQMSRIASQSRLSNRSSPTRNSTFSYDDIQIPQVPSADPSVTDMLHSIREKLTTAPALKSRRALQDLAHQLSAPVARRDSMPRMVQKILDYLATRNGEEVAEALNWVKEADGGSTESFMDLASFITRRPTKG